MDFRKMVMRVLCARQQRDTDIGNRLWTLWEKARVRGFERIAFKHV